MTVMPKDSDSFHRVIGEFIVVFEHTADLLRNGIVHMLTANGLKKNEAGLLIFRNMTIEPIREIFRAMIVETYELTDGDKRVVKGVLKEVTGLIEERNHVVHNCWFIGYGPILVEGVELDSTAFGRRPDASGQGYSPKEVELSLGDFQALVVRAKSVRALVERLVALVTPHENHPWQSGRLEKNYDFHNGDVTIPSWGTIGESGIKITT